jgi:DNA-binding FadR family transcriptional regulator
LPFSTPDPGQPSRPERPSSFADQVYGRILSAIVSGAFPTGARLPSEKELGERFGVSRPVVRDALSRLQRDGLIESRKGSGSFVLASPPEDLSAVADMAQIARYQRYQEFRLVVEGAAAALAAERRSEAALARIVDAHNIFVAEIAQGEFRWQADRAVHVAIAEASGSEFFAASLEGPEARLSEFMTVSLKLTSSRSPRRGQLVAQEHANIVDAIRVRDSVAARVAMEYHIVQARRRMLDRTLNP